MNVWCVRTDPWRETGPPTLGPSQSNKSFKLLHSVQSCTKKNKTWSPQMPKDKQHNPLTSWGCWGWSFPTGNGSSWFGHTTTPGCSLRNSHHLLHKLMWMRGKGSVCVCEGAGWNFRKFDVWGNKRGETEDLKNREESNGWRAYVELVAWTGGGSDINCISKH